MSLYVSNICVYSGFNGSEIAASPRLRKNRQSKCRGCQKVRRRYLAATRIFSITPYGAHRVSKFPICFQLYTYRCQCITEGKEEISTPRHPNRPRKRWEPRRQRIDNAYIP